MPTKFHISINLPANLRKCRRISKFSNHLKCNFKKTEQLGDNIQLGIIFQADGQSFVVKPLYKPAVHKSVTNLEKIMESNLEWPNNIYYMATEKRLLGINQRCLLTYGYITQINHSAQRNLV